MNKFWPSASVPNYPHWDYMHLTGADTFHREIGDIPGITKAQDVFVVEDGVLTIKNPSKPYRKDYL